jgi:large subunit ribosomal protein L43
MAVRGIFQLRNIKLQFCDFGGSSQGVRTLLKTNAIEEFLDRNPHIKLEAYQVRGHHPYIRTEYINGWCRTVSLRNLNDGEILKALEDARSQIGHKAWKHAGAKVYSVRPSIQGRWQPNMWGNTAGVEEFAQRNPPPPPFQRVPTVRKPRLSSPTHTSKAAKQISRSML